MPLGEQFASVLTAARTGAEWAWTRLYDDLAPLVLGYLRTQGAAHAEDVTSEVFLQVVRDLHQFEGSESDFRSWLLSITHHRLIDAGRYEARRPSSPAPAADLEDRMDADTSESEVMDRLTAADLRERLNTLTEDQRAVLVLRFVADLKIREVADILGKSDNAVKQLQRRGLDALRRSIEREA